jgi:tetratricopeptide (TPR) repeat protein
VGDREQPVALGIIRALWPRSPWARALWVGVPALVVIAVLAPVAAVMTVALGVVESVVAPIFASPSGRLLALNLLVLAALVVALTSVRSRWVGLRGGLRLRLLLDGLEAMAEGRDADARSLLERARRAGAPWPSTLPWAGVHAACALARLALRQGDAEAAASLLDGVAKDALPERLRLIVRHLQVAAFELSDEMLPAERLRQIECGLVEFPGDLALLRARRRAEHDLFDAEAAVATQRRIAGAVPVGERQAEEDRLGADLGLCADQALRRGDAALGLRCAEERTRLRPWDAESWLLLGDARAQTADLRGALAAWSEVGDERAVSRAVSALEVEPQALTAEDVLRAFPMDGGLLLVAHIEERCGRPDRAARARRLALRLRPDWSEASGLPTLALAEPPG